MSADENVFHVYPTYGKAHDSDGGPCWCSPERRPVRADVEKYGDAIVGYVVVHAEDN